MDSAELPVFLASVAGVLGLVGIGEWLRHRGCAPETSRRMVHAGVALFVAATPWLYAHPGWVYVLAVPFIGVNLLALRWGWFPGIHGIARPSLGTVTFPMALVLALLVAWQDTPQHRFAIPVAFLLMGLSDPLAAWVGTWAKRPGRFPMGTAVKSLAGSGALLASAGVLAGLSLLGLRADGWIAWSGAAIAVCATALAIVVTAVELLGGRGWDNFFMVLAALVVLRHFEVHPQARFHLPGATGVGVGFGVLTWHLRFLAPSGAVAGGLLAASVVALGGWAWAMPGFTFFLLSSLLSRLGRRRKAPVEARNEKGSVRDAGQVYANGGVAWAFLLLDVFFPKPLWYAAYLGAFAAAAADTWATELGTLWKGQPRLLTTGQVVPCGTSGAVSLPGTAGALLGAAGVCLAAGPWWPDGQALYTLVLIAGGGFAASFVDSLLGATVQAQYQDARSGEPTERPAAGDTSNRLVRGWRWLTNDRVNLACTLCGALLAMLLAWLV